MRTFSETELTAIAAELAGELEAGRGARPRLVLSGPLGAGKSTLARAVLTALGIRREAEGSPTFAIAHEYVARGGRRLVHADGYRLRNESELEATGLLETLWDPEAWVLFEWLELFPDTRDALRSGALPTLWVELGFHADPTLRTLRVERSGGD